MANAHPKWPCVQCDAHAARAVDMLADILELAFMDPAAPHKEVAGAVARCLKHLNTTGQCPTEQAHCQAVADALGHAQKGDWVLCIDALDHP
ncbi:MAG: hypothetical protein ACYTGV_05980 [Planctomycetota bacterium]|jgi:hypothetical protein